MQLRILFVLLSIVLTIVYATSCRQSVEPAPPPHSSDTTSHNFNIVRIDTLGDLFSSIYGMDIVDENNIWVVGTFTKDTAAIDSRYDSLYNAAHWDGLKWTMIRISMQGFGGAADKFPQPLVKVKVFSDTSIFVYSLYDSYAKWDGKVWYSDTVNVGPSGSLWARSENEIYLVGSNGAAVKFNGKSFTKMYTGLTNPPLFDIWGCENNLYAVGFPLVVDQGNESVFLYSTGQYWTVVNRCNIVAQSVTPPNQYVGAMGSVFQRNAQSTLWLLSGTDSWIVYKVTSIAPFHAEQFYKLATGFYATGIRGNGDNDLFVASSHNGEFFHYNGSTWKLITTPITARTGALAVKGDVCVVCGTASRGIVIIMKRT
jgi:hypothetical protein